MKVLFRILSIIIVLSVPMNSFCGEAVKLRFGLSIYLDDKGIGLQRPEGLACNDKSLVVGDTGNNRLVRFMMEDKTVKAGAEIRIPQLSNPICVQINSKGEIFALDGKQRRIVRLNPKGEFRDFLSVEGAPPPSTFVPRSFKIDRTDTIYILDIFSARVLVLNPEGTYQRQIQFPKEYGFFSDLAVDATGTILLLDSIRAQVFSAAPNAAGFAPLTGSLKEYLNFPVNMTTDKQGKMYITDGNGGTIDILAQDGSFLGEQLSSGWNEGLLNFPAQACINEKDEIFIADRGNNRVQLFTIVK